MVDELKEFDNLYYEICNERLASVEARAPGSSADRAGDPRVAEVGKESPAAIAWTVANGSARITDPIPEVSLFNFHYAHPPRVLVENAGLGRPIGDDETGFQGNEDRPYRVEGWSFLLAGGSVYSNLDYSFTTDHEDGTARVESPTPGGGGPSLRAQLATLRQFLSEFEFLRMAPDRAVIASGVPVGASVSVLSQPGHAYAIYLAGGSRATLTLDLPAGRYRAEWVNPSTGAVARTEDLDHDGGRTELGSPDYGVDIALRIVVRP